MNLRESTYSNKYGAKSFSNVDAKLWNLLPMKIRDIHEIVDYKNALKSFEAPILNGNTVYLGLLKWGKERGARSFFDGLDMGPTLFLKSQIWGLGLFLRLKKWGQELFWPVK